MSQESMEEDEFLDEEKGRPLFNASVVDGFSC